MMTAVLVDSNVLLDLMTEDTRWVSCSAEAVERAADRFRLVINPVIHAEVSIHFALGRYGFGSLVRESRPVPV
jgi:predicted nucleic acid-binding protein